MSSSTYATGTGCSGRSNYAGIISLRVLLVSLRNAHEFFSNYAGNLHDLTTPSDLWTKARLTPKVYLLSVLYSRLTTRLDVQENPCSIFPRSQGLTNRIVCDFVSRCSLREETLIWKGEMKCAQRRPHPIPNNPFNHIKWAGTFASVVNELPAHTTVCLASCSTHSRCQHRQTIKTIPPIPSLSLKVPEHRNERPWLVSFAEEEN